MTQGGRIRRFAPLALAVLAVTTVVQIADFANGGGPVVRRGSALSDVLRGTPGADRLYGFAGNDQLFAGSGPDVIVAGKGRDLVVAGKGNDRIDVRDGTRDIVFCGGGNDRVARDAVDVLKPDCEKGRLDPSTLPRAPEPLAKRVVMPPTSTPAPPTVGAVALRLTVRVTGTGSVTSQPSGIACPGKCRASFPRGSRVRLVAAPTSGAKVEDWGSVCRHTQRSCVVRMDGNTRLRVSFTPSGGPVTPPPASPAPPPPPSGNSVVLENEGWTCKGPVNLDLVKITRPPGDAIQLRENCTGRIGRIEIDTWSTDGVKINNAGTVAHDLVIGGGYVKCHGRNPGAHQDAMQGMGGARITFRNVAFDCLGNSNFFVQKGGSGATVPTDIVCEGCRFAGNSATTVFIGHSVRSGARDSVLCKGRFRDYYVNATTPTSPVNDRNVIHPQGDSRCAP